MMASQTAVFTHLVRDHSRDAPPCVDDGATCAEVLRRLVEAEASCVLVLDADRKISGIVTERDVTRRIAGRVGPETPVVEVMSSPVSTIAADDYLYHAVGVMRRRDLRHMPVVDGAGTPVGMLELHDALAVASSQMVDQIRRLTHERTVEGMAAVKAEQIAVAEQLFADNVPAPEILGLISQINSDLHRRVVDMLIQQMAEEGLGPPPLDFTLIVMGSGGRGESAVGADQDNGFILADYDDADHRAVDRWFIDLAVRMTETLHEVGLPLCGGGVMASNALWRKSLSQWRDQVDYWARIRSPSIARLADIFFDFRPVWGDAGLAEELREHVTVHMRTAHPFLQVMYDVQSGHRTALGWFGHLKTHDDSGHDQRGLNLKYDAGLPLVETVRLMALANGIPATSTPERINALAALGMIGSDEHDYLRAAFALVTGLILRQQIADFRAGRTPGYWLDPATLRARERDLLVDGLRAIEDLRDRVKSEFTGAVF
jgi:signal-transduction protein with cAMP-binding, CBS, and nucleotidyltransferase domain